MAQRGKPPVGYYTASTAKRKLGDITDGKLHGYVESKKIRKFVPTGKVQGFYNREDVEKLAREMDDFPTDRSEKTNTKFLVAMKEDISEIVHLLIELFGGGDSSIRRQSWLGKNSEAAFVVKSKGKVVGCVFVLPLMRSKIEAIFADQDTNSSRLIEAEEIQPYQPGKSVCLYVVSMGVRGITPTAKRVRGEILVLGLFKFLRELGRKGIPIELIAGRSETRDGINLLKKMGFTEIESHTINRNFIIEVERSGIPIIMQYKKALHHQE